MFENATITNDIATIAANIPKHSLGIPHCLYFHLLFLFSGLVFISISVARLREKTLIFEAPRIISPSRRFSS